MKSYLAHDKTCGIAFEGGRTACLQWAFSRVEKHPKAVVNILLTRHKSSARVIAEIDEEGGRWIFGGRTVSTTQLNKLLGRVSHG